MDYSNMTITDLKKHCKEHHIRGYSGLRKAEIIQLIQGAFNKTWKIDTNILLDESKLRRKKIDELRYIAKHLGIDATGSKNDLIHSIISIHSIRQYDDGDQYCSIPITNQSFEYDFDSVSVDSLY